MRGFAANNIRDAFIDVQMQAAATQAEKPFFHAYARLPKFEAEKLTRENWLTFADRLEKRLGFDDQPRAVAFHHQANGDTHMHIAWSRIDLESLTAIDPGLYKNKMKQLCREFEQEFGLTKVPNERGKDVKTKSAARAEFEQSRRLGTDLKAIRNTIQECWQSADSGQAFTSALAEHGLILAKGDRRDYVIIDREGGDHALSKRITGATAAATRQRMADIDRATLPSVEDAKASQRERNDRQRATTEAQATTAPDPQQARKAPARNEAETLRLDTGPVSAAAQRDRLVRDAAQLAEAERVQTQMHSARNYREQLEREAEEARKGKGKKEGRESDASLGSIRWRRQCAQPLRSGPVFHLQFPRSLWLARGRRDGRIRLLSPAAGRVEKGSRRRTRPRQAALDRPSPRDRGPRLYGDHQRAARRHQPRDHHGRQ